MSEGLRRLVSWLSFRTIASTSSLRSERGFRSREAYASGRPASTEAIRQKPDGVTLKTTNSWTTRSSSGTALHIRSTAASGTPSANRHSSDHRIPCRSRATNIRGPEMSCPGSLIATAERLPSLKNSTKYPAGPGQVQLPKMLARTVHTRGAVRESVDAWIPGGLRPAHISHEARIAGFISAPAGTSLLREAEAEVIRSGESRVSR
jgi:hypothetical protein